MQSKIKRFVNLKKLTFLPTWFILIIDISISLVIAIISFLIFNEIGVQFYNTLPTWFRFSVILITLSFYFFIFKTYTGIIRYSSLKDASRIFKAVFSTFLTLAIFDWGYFYVTGDHIFVVLTLFFSTLFIFFSLVSFRILIKSMFKYFTGEEEAGIPSVPLQRMLCVFSCQS